MEAVDLPSSVSRSRIGALIKHFKNDPEDSEHDTGYFNLRGNDHRDSLPPRSPHPGTVIRVQARDSPPFAPAGSGAGGGYGSSDSWICSSSLTYAPRRTYAPKLRLPPSFSPRCRPTTPPPQMPSKSSGVCHN